MLERVAAPSYGLFPALLKCSGFSQICPFSYRAKILQAKPDHIHSASLPGPLFPYYNRAHPFTGRLPVVVFHCFALLLHDLSDQYFLTNDILQRSSGLTEYTYHGSLAHNSALASLICQPFPNLLNLTFTRTVFNYPNKTSTPVNLVNLLLDSLYRLCLRPDIALPLSDRERRMLDN